MRLDGEFQGDLAEELVDAVRVGVPVALVADLGEPELLAGPFAGGLDLAGDGLDLAEFAFGGDVGTVRTSTVPAIAAEAEVAIGLVAGLRLSAAAQVRGFPDGTTWVHGGRTLYDAPRVAAGFAVRLGWVFGGEP